jgi:BirA family transcriptional regulator, biotin operon repressor / biotin---[acetyl-CoA-carboxylase] ligase
VTPFDLAAVRASLPGRDLHWNESTSSTMREAARLVDEGAPSGTIVGADEQTAGQGRFGRHWHSEPGTGLYFSVILRLPLAPADTPLVTLALGLATREAILDATAIITDLRWPNDLLIADRKCAGILTQMEGRAVVAGIGINVNQTKLPADIATIATSLRLAAGHPHSREQLLIRLLPAIDEWCALLAREGRDPILRVFAKSSSYVAGRRVTVEISEGETITGTTAGLTADGFLKVRDDRGKEHTIIAGGVRPA